MNTIYWDQKVDLQIFVKDAFFFFLSIRQAFDIKIVKKLKRLMCAYRQHVIFLKSRPAGPDGESHREYLSVLNVNDDGSRFRLIENILNGKTRTMTGKTCSSS